MADDVVPVPVARRNEGYQDLRDLLERFEHS